MQGDPPWFNFLLSWVPPTVTYFDLWAIHTGEPLATEHPEWIMKDQNGNPLYINFACNGTTCSQWAGDISNPAFVQYQISALQTLLNEGYMGVWLDDVDMFIDTSNASGTIVPPIDFTTGQVMTATAWEQHMADFTIAMRQAFPTAQMIHNVQWYAGSWPAGTDPLVQQEILSADYINLERGINDPNLVTGTGSYSMNAKLNFVDVVHSLNRPVIIEEWSFDGDLGLAGYFLISTGMDGFGNTEVTPTDWYPGYDVVLGTPLGVRYDWYGLMRRDFSGGISLLNPFNGPTITLSLPGTYTNTSGTEVTSVTLAGGTGAVLVGPAPSTTPVTIQINAGGPTVGTFMADGDTSTGSVSTGTTTITTTGVANAAPEAVYQDARYATSGTTSFSYVIPNLVPGATYTVRLHFASDHTGSNHILFNVLINGTQVLTNFDVNATAGTAYKAVVETLTGTADGNGNLTIEFLNGTKGSAFVNGLEIIPIPPAPTQIISVTPSAWNFGSQASGTSSAPKTFTVQNVGTGSVPLNSIALTTGQVFEISSNLCSGSLGFGDSCTLGITFTPSQPGAASSDSLTINYASPASTTTVAVSGNAPPLVCTFQLGSTSASVGATAGGQSVGVSAGSNCSWTASSNAAWLTITSGSSGSGNGSVGYSIAANASSSQRAGTLTIAGQTFTVTQGGMVTSSAPTALSVSPATGSGQSQAFAATYSDPSGASAITTAYIVIGSSATSPDSCELEYSASTNTYFLMNDDGSWSAPLSPGDGTASNSQCTFSSTSAGATPSGNNLVVNFPLIFAASYAGTQNIYLNVTDGTGLSSGWQQLGSFTVTGGNSGASSSDPVPVCNAQGFPCVVSLSPSSGSGISGTFTGVFNHSGGATQHYLGYILFLPTPNIVDYTATGSCLVEYNRIDNAMRLINNAGTDWLPGNVGIALTQGGTLSNNFCTLDVTNSSAVINGTTMTVTVAMTFSSTFTGQLATFLQAFDITGAFTGMTQFGNWEVNAGTRKTGPYVVDLSPTSGAGSSATLTFTAGDTKGVMDLDFVTMLISPVIEGSLPCQAFYFPYSNTINLVNDSSTAMVSTTGIVPGKAGTLSNSRCSIDTGSASSSSTTDNVTVTLPMTFDATTFGGPKKIYLNAFDDFGNLSHWVTSGTWTVQ